ncbi:hypothetical protein [Vibrio sp. WXL103]|uniref:hypothetical protein n=1 Tax=unclassified Vibrio TaxID=2614977 RepID=UPI003EC8EBA6
MSEKFTYCGGAQTDYRWMERRKCDFTDDGEIAMCAACNSVIGLTCNCQETAQATKPQPEAEPVC